MSRTSGTIPKLDRVAVAGLLGGNNSLAYKVHEIEKHLHNSEYWYGNAGSSSMDRANNTQTPWTLTANVVANTYGTEVQIASANDFTADGMASAVNMDVHRILVTESSANDQTYVIQLWCGTSTFGAATFCTEVPYRTGGAAAEVVPVPVICPRIAVGDKLWTRVKCSSGGATLDFFLGLHGYVG